MFEDMQEQVILKFKVKGVVFIMFCVRGNSWYVVCVVELLIGEMCCEFEYLVSYICDLVNGFLGDDGYLKMFVIGGFSQGVCLVFEYVMWYGLWYGVMVNFIGCCVGILVCDCLFVDFDWLQVYFIGLDWDFWILVDVMVSVVEVLLWV